MASTALARCTEPGCPWRFTSGPDRRCAPHRAEDGDTPALADRAAAWGAVMAAPPGHRSPVAYGEGDRAGSHAQ